VLSLGTLQRLRLCCAACADDTNEYDYSEVGRSPGALVATVDAWPACMMQYCSFLHKAVPAHRRPVPAARA
jgi:hypothetical protein